MNTSETIGELTKALANAQSQMGGAKKTSENPHFRSKYADLESCWEACRGPLSSNGLSVVQGFDGINEHGYMILESRLSHVSGEWIESRLIMPMEKQTPQGLVSASTYARRAALCALVGLAPTDDDGESAEGRQFQAPAQKKAPAQRKKPPVKKKIESKARGTNPASSILQERLKGFVDHAQTQEELDHAITEIQASADNLTDSEKGKLRGFVSAKMKVVAAQDRVNA